VLVVMRWTRAGEVEPTWPRGFQEGGVDPFLYWYAVDVEQESPASFLVFGGAGTPKELRSRHADGTIVTTVVAERPGPAVFRIRHPAGIDTNFVDHGAAVIRIPIPEAAFSTIAGGFPAAATGPHSPSATSVSTTATARHSDPRSQARSASSDGWPAECSTR
jgi:hypothetical protein